MRSNRSPSVRFARTQRRKLVWARVSNLPTGTAVTAGTIISTDMLADYITQAGGDTLNGATVMGVRGRIQVSTTAALGATRNAFTYGFKVCDAQEIAVAAVNAVHGPATTGRYDDWMHRDYIFSEQTASVSLTAQQYYPLQVKSRRKLDELNKTLGAYFEGHPGNVNVLNIAFEFDTLLALP